MAEYIEREKAEKILYDGCHTINGRECPDDVVELWHMVQAIPSADVQPVRHGRWTKMDMHKGIEQYKCSVCRSECYVPECMGEPIYAYCPNCGAKMDGGRP